MFHRNPVGKYVLQVCTTLSCALPAPSASSRAAAQARDQAGRDRPTGMFTIQPMECLGACDARR
jgi:NADH:ubiquinone oxidoreductase subunit E